MLFFLGGNVELNNFCENKETWTVNMSLFFEKTFSENLLCSMHH